MVDSDAEDLADLAGGLHADLLDVDVASVASLTAEAAKGLGTLVGWLLVGFGTPTGVRAVLRPCAGGSRGRAKPSRSTLAGTR